MADTNVVSLIQIFFNAYSENALLKNLHSEKITKRICFDFCLEKILFRQNYNCFWPFIFRQNNGTFARMKQEQARKLRALRHWGYLRRVARAIGRNQLDMKLREKARLESEMEQRRLALAAEEVMMEKARLEAEEKDKKEKEGEEDTGKEDPEEAESFE